MNTATEMVFLNGRILPAAEAQVSVFDAGFTHAAGLFETMRVYHGHVMRLSDHLDRLSRSAATLEMQSPLPQEAVRRGIDDLLAVGTRENARLRLTVTAGTVPHPGEAADAPQQPTLLITADDVRPYPPELHKVGMRVCICPYKQSRFDPLAGHKTLAYLPRLLAMKHAAGRKCHEALWFNTENQLAEGSICNVFIVQNGTLVTPPDETPILPGIVRKIVFELADADATPIEQRPIIIDDLLAATEVFLTGSVMEIMPVTHIEKHKVADGAPGELTRRLRERYTELVAKECG